MVGRAGKQRIQLLEAGLARLEHGAGSVEPHDSRRPVEGAEHHADPAVLAEVRDRLDAAAGEIEVGDMSRGSRIRKVSRPFGERLTSPSGASGAVATKKTCCFAMKPGEPLVIWSNALGHAARV